MWLIHFTHSYWWKTWSWSKFASHYTWGTNEACECKMDAKSTWILHDIKWIMFHCHLDYFQKSPLGGRLNTKPQDYGTQNAHYQYFILLYYVWGPAWIEIHWNNIWLKAWSHRVTHYTWGYVTTLFDFGDVLGWPLDTIFWALIVAWTWLLAPVWSGDYQSRKWSLKYFVS